MRRNLAFVGILICALVGIGQTTGRPVAGSRAETDMEAGQLVPAVLPSQEANNAQANNGEPYSDHRAWQHGINCIHVGSRCLLIWSSWGNPPAPQWNPEENWQHDVYYSWIDPAHPQLDPQILASGQEAQEPASAAINASGRILVSCEDGSQALSDDLSQYAGLWDANLNPIRPYPFDIRSGGHSGHVAALGDKFLVVYSEGWVDGGGVDNLGTGDDVWARIVDGDGNPGIDIPVSVDSDPEYRDWWPVVAASDHNWMEVWQRYPAGTLNAALIQPDGTVLPPLEITDNIKFYYYNVKYLPSLHLFAVFGSRQDGGFVSLIDTNGNIVLTQTGLPDTVRESQLVTRGQGSVVTAVYPTRPGGAAVLKITPRSVKLTKTIPHPYTWDTMGTEGMFVSKHKALFATLSKAGLQLVTMDGI